MSQDRALDLFWRSWTVPKDGNKPEQNEDAARIEFLPSENGPGVWLIAVADGATEAVYSGLWARTLVAAAAPDWPLLSDDELDAQLNHVRRSFVPIKPDEQTPWYVRNKFVAQGSQATLLAARVESLEDTEEFIIRAVSVGDCCLLLFKGNGEMGSFPVSTSADFGVHPSLVGSRPQTALDYRRWEARLQSGDLLLACTDAVGRWILQCVESNQVGLLYTALLDLLAPTASEPSLLAERSESAHSESVTPQQISAEDESLKEDHEQHTSLLGRLQRLIHRPRPPEEVPSEPMELDPVDTDTAEVAPIDTDVTESNQQTTPAMAPPLPLDFSLFIERWRALESKPRMRNDDATLIVCLPLRDDGTDQQLEAIF